MDELRSAHCVGIMLEFLSTQGLVVRTTQSVETMSDEQYICHLGETWVGKEGATTALVRRIQALHNNPAAERDKGFMRTVQSMANRHRELIDDLLAGRMPRMATVNDYGRNMANELLMQIAAPLVSSDFNQNRSRAQIKPRLRHIEILLMTGGRQFTLQQLNQGL